MPAGGSGSMPSSAAPSRFLSSTTFLVLLLFESLGVFMLLLGFSIMCMTVIVGFAGIFATFAALMFNCVRKEDIDYSPYEEGEWRSGISLPLPFAFFCWLFVLVF